MKTFGLFVITLSITLTAAYNDVDDTIDFEAMLKTPSDLRILLDCYLDAAPCPPKFIPYRTHAGQAMDDACRECNLAQKHNTRLILKELKQLFPEDYKKLGPKYDVDGKHFKVLEDKVSKY